MAPSIAAPVTIDSAGRIVLPSGVRHLLNLKPGSRLRLEVVAQRIELTPEPDGDAALQAVPGKRTVLRPSGQASDAGAAVRAERDAQARGAARE